VTTRVSAVELIGRLFDDASFSAWDDDVVSTDPLSFSDTMAYRERLRLSAERSGANESILTGRACLAGHDVAVIAGEFHFLAGTLGVATATRVVRAFDRATELRLPVVALPISGGTRMQEGVAAFIQMAACAAAVRRFRDAGLLYAVYLRNPTTGGVLASWASLAHVRWAEPGALIGLTGPRVAKEMTGQPFPEGVQVAEHLAAHGVLDEVVAIDDLRVRLAGLLGTAAEPVEGWEPAVAPAYLPDDAEVAAWDAVQWSRRPDRPGLTELLGACDEARGATVRGDGAGEDDDGCLVAVTRLCGHSAVLVATRRPAGERGASLTAAGYRKARRGIVLAGELGLPLVTIIDTAGAAITPHDERSGLAGMIAECLAAMSSVRSPTLSVLLGEGAGGGAVALLPADRVLAAEHAWLAPIAPEGASAILYRTADRAPQVAAAQHIATPDLRRLGIVDAVVPDRGEDAPAALAAAIGAELGRLVGQDPAERQAARVHRYRTIAR
jgi:acetyl-CoA carboxylase carboxyl transferase subunit beta